MRGLIGWLVVTYAAAGVGSAAAANAGAFYDALVRPEWAPPAWVFGPVWTVLYGMMAIAAWLVWKERGLRLGAVPLGIFLVQLAVNALWSWLFFTFGLGAMAFVDIVVLWLLIVATIVTFKPISTLAGWLLVPYLLWVSFATLLTYTIWQMNPGTLT